MPSLKQFIEALAPATLAETALALGNLASGAAVSIPVVVARGARPGKCLWINGQVHGDELNGVFAALEFVRALPLAKLTGTVVVTATANPWALNIRRKRATQDDLDLDQSFPGHADGLTTERTAAKLFEAVSGCADALVSMHTMGTPFDCSPFAVYKVASTGGIDEMTLLKMLAQFEPGYACYMPVHSRPGELPGHLAGSIDYQLLEAGKPSFMIELGAGGRRDEQHVKQGVEGMAGVAGLLGMLEGATRPVKTVRRVKRYQHVTCTRGGLFRASKRPDAVLGAGEVYGEIIDLHGKVVETLSIDHPVRLIGIRRDPVVHSGERVSFVAHEWDDVAL